ncbi:hypothetical protein L1887_62276 [Cichorium endivia]|nr:hypothetical protein L1887_62276 [Cichorium endivia]
MSWPNTQAGSRQHPDRHRAKPPRRQTSGDVRHAGSSGSARAPCASDLPSNGRNKSSSIFVWTWSNSSLTRQAHDRIDPAKTSSSHSHAEASDFMRYSFRSAQQHMHHGFGRVTLLTPDLPKDKLATQALEACTRSYQDAQGLRIFMLGAWIDQDEPFSSALLAAQAPGMSDVRLLVAPHHVFARPVSASDFWSPLYGATYRFDPEAQVSSAAASPMAGQEALQKPNALLDARFGVRPRRKLLDLPVPVSASILAEMRQIWPDVLKLTPKSQSARFDFGFLAAHYVLERHREALLWSFVVAKHDRDADGLLSAAEAEAVLKDLGIDAHKAYAAPQVELPRRGTRSAATVVSNLRRAQMPERLGKESMSSSMDGLAFLTPRSSDAQEGAAAEEAQPPVCRLDRECVKPLLDAVSGSDPPRVSEVLRRVAFQAPMFRGRTHDAAAWGDAAFGAVRAHGGAAAIVRHARHGDALAGKAGSDHARGARVVVAVLVQAAAERIRAARAGSADRGGRGSIAELRTACGWARVTGQEQTKLWGVCLKFMVICMRCETLITAVLPASVEG